MEYYLIGNRPIHFPHPQLAGEYGLLCISQQLHAETVIAAYRCGIFPWYTEEYPVMWYYTDPRAVLETSELYISKSMRQLIRRSDWHCTVNQDFPQVIRYCRDVSRRDQEGSWIHPEIIDVYTELHDRGYVYSIEVWDGEELIAGLYGMLIGRIFYGESMMTRRSNASKYGFIYWTLLLRSLGVEYIDCQQDTEHLSSLGADLLSSEEFLDILRYNSLTDDFILSDDIRRMADSNTRPREILRADQTR